MHTAATCVWWRATMVRGCFVRSGTSFMLVRMFVVQFNVSPRFPARNGIRAQQTESTPRRRENYSTDSPMISKCQNERRKHHQINYSTKTLKILHAHLNPSNDFQWFVARLSVEEFPAGELKYNIIPIGDSQAGKLLHRKWMQVTLGIYGGRGWGRQQVMPGKPRTIRTPRAQQTTMADRHNGLL